MTQQALQAHQCSWARSEAQVGVLSVLRDEPLTSMEIARRVGFTWESVRWALNRLLALGKVERQVLAGAGSRWCYGWRLVDEAAAPSGGDRV